MYLNDLVSFEVYSVRVHLNCSVAENPVYTLIYSVKYVNIGIYFAVFSRH